MSEVPPIEPSPTDGAQHPKMPNVARAGGIMMASLFLSRVLGILRDTVMAAKFGVGIDTDAYRLAFQIPDLIFFALAGGALSSAFIPVFSEYFHTDREDDAWKLFSVVTTVMSAVIIAVIAVLWIFAEPVASLVAPGKAPEVIPLIAHMSRIVLPAQFAFFVGGLMFGTLYARQQFAVPGLGPNIYNIGIIFGALVLSNFLFPPIVGMSWGALIGAVVGNLLIPLWAMRKIGARFTPSFDVKHAGVRKVFVLMLPVVLGLSLPGVYGLIMQAFGSYYADGINTALDLSNKLMQAPLGIFGQSLALAVFPALSQYFAQGEMGLYRSQLAATLKTVIYITVPVSVLMWVFAGDIVNLAFAYGKAGSADLSALVLCLRMFSIGVFAWCLHPVLMRAFFAMQKSVTPVVLGTLTTGLFLGLALALRQTSLSYLALPLASSISALALAAALLWAISAQAGRAGGNTLDIAGILATFFKSAIASALVGGLCYLALMYLPTGAGLGRNAWALGKLAIVGLGAIWIYYFLTRLLGMKETGYFDRVLRKLGG